MVANRLAVLAAIALVACGGREEALVVYSAASLTETFMQVGEAWSDGGHALPRFSFSGTSTLARQITAGAPADIFASADTRWMDELERGGHIIGATRADLLSSRMVVIVPDGTTTELRLLADLQAQGIARIGVAGENVPAGRYAQAIIAAAELGPSLEPRLVRGDNVRSVLAWVAAAEVDAGFVYATDARIEPNVRVAFTVPAGLAPDIKYPVALVAGTHRSAQAQAFIEFLASPSSRAIFERAGFEFEAQR